MIFLGLEEGQRLILIGLGAITLHVAVERSQSDIMARLVAAGIRIEAWDTYGGTALEDATMADFLLDPRHPFDVENNNRETPSSWSAPWNAITFHRNERKNYGNSTQSWGRP